MVKGVSKNSYYEIALPTPSSDTKKVNRNKELGKIPAVKEAIREKLMSDSGSSSSFYPLNRVFSIKFGNQRIGPKKLQETRSDPNLSIQTRHEIPGQVNTPLNLEPLAAALEETNNVQENASPQSPNIHSLENEFREFILK